MSRNILIFVGGIIIILFFALYFSQYTEYYDYSSNRKTVLTEEAIERFESDIKEGKEIDASNYLVEEKNYSNKMSRLGMRVSSVIEKAFNKGMNALFKELEKAISSNN